MLNIFDSVEISNSNLSWDFTCPGMLCDPEHAYEMLTYVS